MFLGIEGIRMDEVRDVVDSVRLQKEGPEEGALRLKGLRRNSIGSH